MRIFSLIGAIVGIGVVFSVAIAAPGDSAAYCQQEGRGSYAMEAYCLQREREAYDRSAAESNSGSWITAIRKARVGHRWTTASDARKRLGRVWVDKGRDQVTPAAPGTVLRSPVTSPSPRAGPISVSTTYLCRS